MCLYPSIKIFDFYNKMKKLFLKTKTSNHACNSSTLDSIIETSGFINMSLKVFLMFLKVQHIKRIKEKKNTL